MELSANTEVLKEPRGFIKLIEIILAICAFATAVGPHISTSFSYSCDGTSYQTKQFSFQYPYRFYETKVGIPLCEGSWNSTETTSVMPPGEIAFAGDCQSSSEFYVFVGVTAFLCSLAAIIFYVFAHRAYAELGIIPKADFIMTVVFTLLWLISSSAFAAALSKIKNVTDPESLWKSEDVLLRECSPPSVVKCVSNHDGNYSTLNVSVIFGFLNMIVWGGNNWFLYKETTWFGTDSSSPTPAQPMPGSTSEIQPRV